MFNACNICAPKMAYRINLLAAARRHAEAARRLDKEFPEGRRDIAAYLHGICAECALKYMMQKSGMTPAEDRRDDPFYMHFPELKTMLRDTARGRYQGRLLKHAGNASLMNGWDVRMRYASTEDVLKEKVDDWKSSAEALLQEIEEI